jgi:hypothetical protein
VAAVVVGGGGGGYWYSSSKPHASETTRLLHATTDVCLNKAKSIFNRYGICKLRWNR